MYIHVERGLQVEGNSSKCQYRVAGLASSVFFSILWTASKPFGVHATCLPLTLAGRGGSMLGDGIIPYLYIPVMQIDYSGIAGITHKAGGGILRNSKDLELYLERLSLNYTLCVVLGNLNARWKPSTSAVSCCSLVRDTALAPANQTPVIQLPGLPRAFAISTLTLAVTCTLVLPYE